MLSIYVYIHVCITISHSDPMSTYLHGLVGVHFVPVGDFAGSVALQDTTNNQTPLRWRQNGRDSVSNHQPRGCLLNRLFRRRSKKTSKLLVTGLCAGNSPGTGEFPAQMASYAENVSIWWRHHATFPLIIMILRLFSLFRSQLFSRYAIAILHLWRTLIIYWCLVT